MARRVRMRFGDESNSKRRTGISSLQTTKGSTLPSERIQFWLFLSLLPWNLQRL
jgi:hypothetical protein